MSHSISTRSSLSLSLALRRIESIATFCVSGRQFETLRLSGPPATDVASRQWQDGPTIRRAGTKVPRAVLFVGY